MKKYLLKSISRIFKSGTYTITFIVLSAVCLPTPAKASECYDHWNGDAWHGAAEWAIVLCLDSATMKKCEVRYHNGAKILDLQQHFGLDRGRIIWTNYEVYSFQYPGLLDVVCTSVEDLTYTFTVTNTPNAWWDWGACAAGTDYGGASCKNDQDEITLQVIPTGGGNGTVSRSPEGVNCSSTEIGELCYHAPGAQVTLTANPEPGSIFSGWSGGGEECSGASTCIVPMDKVQEVTATFNKYSGAGVMLLLNQPN